MKEDVAQTKIEHSASEAIRVVADAASKATQVVADAAVEAAKVINAKFLNDHDLLIELKTKMEGIKDDIRALTDGVSKQINDHEVRLNNLETERTKTTVMLSIGVGILTLLVSLLTYHLFQG